MNYLPQEIEKKILDYDDNYTHMFICKSWFNVIKEKYNIKKELATTLWKEIDGFKEQLEDENVTIATKHPLRRSYNDYYSIDYEHFTIDSLLKRLIYKKPMHIYFYTGDINNTHIFQWDYNDYLQFKRLKVKIRKILNKVLKYKVKLHRKNYKYVLNGIDLTSRFDYFEFIMW